MSALSDYRAAGGDPDSSVNQRILGQLVGREVLHCISSTVSALSTLLQGEHTDVSLSWEDDIYPLLQQDDWQEPGEDCLRGMDMDELLQFCVNNDLYADCEREVPFTDDDDDGHIRDVIRDHIEDTEEGWEEFCRGHQADPYVNEVYEHWAVTDFFKRKLAEHGEITGSLLDFDVWGRCCTGQAICRDWVIAEIAAEMEILHGQANSWER